MNLKESQMNNPLTSWQSLREKIFSPSITITEVGARRKAQVLAVLSLLLVFTNLVGSLAIPGNIWQDNTALSLFGVSIVMLVVYLLSRSRYYYAGAWLFVAVWGSTPIFLIASGVNDNILASILSFTPFAFITATVLLSVRDLWILTFAISVPLYLMPLYFPFATPVDGFSAGGINMILGFLSITVASLQNSVERARLSELRQTNEEINVLRSSLESRVAERTNALAVSSRISRRLSTILDPAQLVLAVVEQVKTAFNYYHVHIYFLDEGGQKLKMMGGTGEAGQMMLREGHAIPLEKGLVGRAARLNQVVLVADTDMEPGWLSNPLLPETKSELAIPIAFNENVMGVLDVQHNIVNGLTQDDVDLLQSIANQVAIAIQNARQYVQAQESEGRLRAMIDAIPTGVMITRIKDGLVQYANDNAAALFAYPLASLIGNVTPNLYYNLSDRETVLNILRKEGSLSNYEVLGRRQDGSSIWVALSVQTMIYADEPAFYINATDITERKQAAEALTKRAEHDRVLSRISTKIRSAVSVEQILQIATQELRQATGASRSVVEIVPIEQKTVEFSRD